MPRPLCPVTKPRTNQIGQKEKKKLSVKCFFLYLDDSLVLVHVTPSRKVGDSFIVCIFEACALQTCSIPISAFFCESYQTELLVNLAVFGFYEPHRTIF